MNDLTEYLKSPNNYKLTIKKLSPKEFFDQYFYLWRFFSLIEIEIKKVFPGAYKQYNEFRHFDWIIGGGPYVLSGHFLERCLKENNMVFN